MSENRLIPAHGGYRKLRSFQTAQTVYDLTVLFCNRFIDKRSRTHDQMVQAARSGVARASLEELLLDYEDFLRQRGLKIWSKDSPEALSVRAKFKSDRSDVSDKADPYGVAAATDQTAANTLICLINQASYLLRKQLENLEKTFLTEGGFTERLYRQRKTNRDQPA